MGSRLRTASWVLLAIAAGLTLFFSLVSSYRAYWGNYPIGRVPVAQVAAGREDVLTALRGIRGTSAAYCIAPVWGSRNPAGPTERRRMATAPCRAAR